MRVLGVTNSIRMGALMVVTPVRQSVVVASLSRIPMRFPVPSSSQATMTNGLGGVRTQVVSDHRPTPYYVKLFGKCQRNVGQTSSHRLGVVRLLTPPKPCYDAFKCMTLPESFSTRRRQSLGALRSWLFI